MQTRTSFNGGELSREMAARCDMDAYMRGCQVLENWELGTMGGVKRRRGMRGVREAMGGESRLVSYVYTHAGEGGRYLVELGRGRVRVLSPEGEVEAEFVSGEGGCTAFYLDVDEVRTCQVNAVLFLTCRSNMPLALRWDGEGAWSLEQVVFKNRAWRYDYERRDWPVVLSAKPGSTGMVYQVGLEKVGDEREAEIEGSDVMRVSFWVEQAEARSGGEELRAGVRVVSGLVACAAGERVAQKKDEGVVYWVCKKEFPADVYVEGLDDPGCYPDNFERSETVSGFEGCDEVASVRELGSVDKGKKFAIRAGYWEYWTCVRAFGEGDKVAGANGYGDYTGYFVRGIAVGEALPCGGKWQFYCSGLWYGSYEVRRSYEGTELSREWETAGVSWSRLSEASNEQLAGDEGGEECWLRLFLTRSKYMTEGVLADGFPADSSGNRLVVEGYRHDMVLVLDDEGVWRCEDRIDIGWTGRREVYDWSWAAFSERYGYPLCCEVFGQRLVFASTEAQPQSVWMSRTDDLYNFATGDTDDSAIYRTLYTKSQDPICWMLEYRGMLMLGTSVAEWTIEATSGNAVSPGSLVVRQHGRVGSDGGQMLAVEDKALYVERGGGRLWEYGYSFEVDGCRSRDLTVMAPHVLREHGGVVGSGLVKKPDVTAVFVLADGQVALCAYNAMHQVAGWHRWVTDGEVRSVAVLPDGVRGDRLYFVVKRDDGVWVECVDEVSEYTDRGGRGYESVLVTTALGNVLEEMVRKRPKERVMVLLGGDVETAGLEVRANAGAWARPAVTDAVLRAGWQPLLMFNRWECTNEVGLRYVAASGCEVLALQG